MSNLSDGQDQQILSVVLENSSASPSSPHANDAYVESFTQGLSPIASPHGRWIIDSGVTDHYFHSAYIDEHVIL